jgi:hypothetical protein
MLFLFDFYLTLTYNYHFTSNLRQIRPISNTVRNLSWERRMTVTSRTMLPMHTLLCQVCHSGFRYLRYCSLEAQSDNCKNAVFIVPQILLTNTLNVKIYIQGEFFNLNTTEPHIVSWGNSGWYWRDYVLTFEYQTGYILVESTITKSCQIVNACNSISI